LLIKSISGYENMLTTA